MNRRDSESSRLLQNQAIGNRQHRSGYNRFPQVNCPPCPEPPQNAPFPTGKAPAYLTTKLRCSDPRQNSIRRQVTIPVLLDKSGRRRTRKLILPDRPTSKYVRACPQTRQSPCCRPF